MGPKLTEMTELAVLIEEARKRGPMTDEERREQAASFAFGNLALTREWCDKTADQLAELRETCRRMAGCKGTYDRKCRGCKKPLGPPYTLCASCADEAGP